MTEHSHTCDGNCDAVMLPFGPQCMDDAVRDRYPNQILPGQELDGGIVIASVILNEEDYDDVIVTALLLMPTPGTYYRLVELKQNSREITMRIGYPNIVPAVEAYQENGGDY